MGANFETMSIKACSVEQMRKTFRDNCQEIAYQRGSDTYAGHIGMASGLIVTSHVFKKYDDAYAWLDSNTEKHGEAKAVKVGDFSKTYPRTEAEKKMETAYQELKSQIENWSANVLKRTKEAKSLYRSCDKCGSKISVKHLHDSNCPVCNSNKFLVTDTDTKKLNALKESYKKLSVKRDTNIKKYDIINKTTFWLIGATVSC